MGYTQLDKESIIDSGNAIAALLNASNIMLNGKFGNVKKIGYADSTDELVFETHDRKVIIFPRVNFGVADWDEDENDAPFYLVMDGDDIVHLFRFLSQKGNVSLEVMQKLKELL